MQNQFLIAETAAPAATVSKGRKYSVPRHRCTLVRESSLSLNEWPSISSSESVNRLAKELLDTATQEEFWLLCLDTKNRLTSASQISVGTINSSIVHPRDVFKVAILANAAGVIFLHNHPSGDPSPSPEDMQLTRRLVEAGSMLGIKALDHIIHGQESGRYYSFSDSGMM